mmetsp:Transcript_14501/g.60497  ORF Transcript_14501/g.60497 Transcript_14501/m.60497 type:complete len:262 (+) Transcript_14501:429-1214(+)
MHARTPVSKSLSHFSRRSSAAARCLSSMPGRAASPAGTPAPRCASRAHAPTATGMARSRVGTAPEPGSTGSTFSARSARVTSWPLASLSTSAISSASIASRAYGDTCRACFPFSPLHETDKCTATAPSTTARAAARPSRVQLPSPAPLTCTPAASAKILHHALDHGSCHAVADGPRPSSSASCAPRTRSPGARRLRKARSSVTARAGGPCLARGLRTSSTPSILSRKFRSPFSVSECCWTSTLSASRSCCRRQWWSCWPWS